MSYLQYERKNKYLQAFKFKKRKNQKQPIKTWNAKKKKTVVK